MVSLSFTGGTSMQFLKGEPRTLELVAMGDGCPNDAGSVG